MPQDINAYGTMLGGSRNPFSYEKIEQVSRDVTSPWLDLEEISQQINLVDDESQDAYLQSLDLATRMAIEDLLGLTIFPVTYRVYYGTYGTMGSNICLDLPDVSQDNITLATVGVTIDKLGYWNGNVPPVFTELAITDYMYDPTGNKVIVYSGIPSEINNIMTSPIVLTYTTNPSPLADYPVIKQAGLLLLTHLYNNRSNTDKVMLHDIPFGVHTLLRPYKPLVL